MADDEAAPSRIVVGVDGSDSSTRALRWALNQAKATGAVVEAVHAWEVTSSFGMPPAVLPGDDPAATAEQVLATAVDRAAGGKPPVPVERQVVRGNPVAVLLERAKDAELLVVGSHGHGGFLGALIGSVSQHCVQHAACPVVVVRTGA